MIIIAPPIESLRLCEYIPRCLVLDWRLSVGNFLHTVQPYYWWILLLEIPYEKHPCSLWGLQVQIRHWFIKQNKNKWHWGNIPACSVVSVCPSVKRWCSPPAGSSSPDSAALTKTAADPERPSLHSALLAVHTDKSMFGHALFTFHCNHAECPRFSSKKQNTEHKQDQTLKQHTVAFSK